jgi:hypothetical protein
VDPVPDPPLLRKIWQRRESNPGPQVKDFGELTQYKSTHRLEILEDTCLLEGVNLWVNAVYVLFKFVTSYKLGCYKTTSNTQ